MSFPTERTSGNQPTVTHDPFGSQEKLAPLVSVIVPTYCEAENLQFLVPEVSKALDRSGMSFEMLVVDDNSPDKTIEVCGQLAKHYPVRLLTRTTERGLSSAVVHGLQRATGSVLLVMDADLSHPPDKVPEMVAAVLEQQGDFVIGSRYVPGGSTDDEWGLFRWLNSKVATWLARGLTSSQDPMAGFFALSRQTWEKAEELSPIGYKIGLELIVKCGCSKVAEVPIHFRDRVHGESKLSLKEQLNYLRHLGRLYRYKMGRFFAPLCFAMVGLSGAVVDLLLFSGLLLLTSFGWARGLAIAGAMTWNFFGNRHTTFSDRRSEPVLLQYFKFVASCLVGGAISWGLSTLLWQNFQEMLVVPQIAAGIGIVAGALWNYLLSANFVFRKADPELERFLGREAQIPRDPVSVIRTQKKTEESSYVSGTEAIKGPRARSGYRVLGGILVVAISLAVTWSNWTRGDIDGLDQAHNILTSYYFHDLLVDRPVASLAEYTFEYQRQYPALGLLFWPPLFHAAAGLLMFPFGASIATVYMALTGFALLFAATLYAALNRTLSPAWAVLAVAIAVTVPVLFELQNSVMLEVPALAMCGLTLWLYLRLTQRGEWTSLGEAVFAGCAAAAIAYAKQPAVFVLFGLFLDVVVNHRQLLKQKQTWACVGTAAVCLLPLALFTWKFGHVNMAQAFGNEGNIYVEHHRVADRWSVAGWTYYLQLVPAQLGWIFSSLAVAGLALIACSREAARKHGVWLWSVVAWYLLFSYFDNKQVRFVAFVIPLLSAAAVIFVAWVCRRQQMVGNLAFGLLLGGVAMNVWAAGQHAPDGYGPAESILRACDLDANSGNIAYFGEDHHLFTAHLRGLDADRQHGLVRGAALLSELESREGANRLTELLTDYGVRWVMVDPDLPAGQKAELLMQLESDAFRPLVPAQILDNGQKPIRVAVYAYGGKLAETRKVVPLRNEILELTSTK